MKKIITRFAPSPTGFLHIGGVRTALFSWAYAKKNNGNFILRVEDTDLERSTPEAIEAIKKGLQWLGIDNDGPIVYQTERYDRYKEIIMQLLDEEKAYYCYASKDELDALRIKQKDSGQKPKYDNRWRPENGKDLPNPPDGINPVVRFKNPLSGSVTWNDKVKKEITISNNELDDFIIARSDGSPTYNFCVVVDDMDMNISHVIRGDDHVNNTPRQINLFEALNAQIPTYAHLSMILGSDGQKLSKRHGAVSVMEYKENGFLPDALKNYLARLGWSHGDDEIFSMHEFCSLFDFKNIISSAAQFDEEKLNWLNNHYIKEMNIDELASHIEVGASIDQDIFQKAITLYRDRAKSLNEISQNIKFFFEIPYIPQDLIDKYINKDTMKLVDALIAMLSKEAWDDDTVNLCVKKFVKDKEIKFPIIAMPLRVILAGTDHTPSIGSIMSILGNNEVNKRLQHFKKNHDL